MQIQMSSQTFLVFYGDGFSDNLTDIINSLREANVSGFELKWLDDCALIVPYNCSRKVWYEVIEKLFVNVSERGEEEDE